MEFIGKRFQNPLNSITNRAKIHQHPSKIDPHSEAPKKHETKGYPHLDARLFAAWTNVIPKVQNTTRNVITTQGKESILWDTFLDGDITTVITVCGNADQACPAFPGQVNRYHWGFDDPAHAQGSEEEIMEEFRNVRDRIRLVFEAYASGIRENLSLIHI